MTLIDQPTSPPASAAVTRSRLSGTLPPSTELEHEHRADERVADQRRHTGRAAADGGRARDATQQPTAIAEKRSGRNAHVRRRRLRPHRRAETDRGDDRNDARWSEAPREPLLGACRRENVRRSGRPGSRRARVGRQPSSPGRRDVEGAVSGVSLCRAAPRLYPFRTSTENPSPTRGITIVTQVSCRVTTARSALITWVTSTAVVAPTSPPITPPTA